MSSVDPETEKMSLQCVFDCRVSPEYHLRAEYALRLGLVLLTFSLAAAVPKLDLFISLVGAVSRLVAARPI